MRQMFICCLILLSGCAGIDKAMTGSSAMPTQEQRSTVVTQFPELSESQRQKFIEGSPWIGMTRAQLIAMWGNEPTKSQKKLTPKGNETTEIYAVRVGDWKTGIKTQYYKVKSLDGKVTELQELDSNVGSLDNL